MKIIFGTIGSATSIIDIALLILGLPMAVIIDLGGSVNIKFFNGYAKVVGVLLVVSVVTCIVALL
jgi:hypothetical protein